MSVYIRARGNMIEGQLRPNRVTSERLLAVMADLPREQFVPEAARAVAYVDESIDLGNGRYMIEPMVLARLIQALDVRPSEVVLDIGAGTGYAAAVLARLAATVVAIEEVPALACTAMTNLQKCGADNAVVLTAPLAVGHPRQAPYNVILLEGGVSREPSSLLEQLAEGGRLAAVRIGRGPVGQAWLWQRSGGIVTSRVLFDAGVPILPGFSAAAGFVFQ